MSPPLAGRPPFATDEPDSYYEPQPGPQRRYRQPALPNPNDRTSAYAMYDDYLNDFHSSEDLPQSSAGADNPVPSPSSHNHGAPALSGHVLLAAAAGLSPKSPTFPQPSRQIAAPRPGYVAPIATFELVQSTPAVPLQPSPVTRKPPPLTVNVNSFEFQRPAQQQRPPQDPFQTPRREHFPPPQSNHHGPYPHMNRQPPPRGTPTSIPSTPHPLQPPVTPITPVFVRPSKVANVREEQIIMRGKAEDTVLPLRGQMSDDFWRRFSMIIHEQEKPNGTKKSPWLRKTQSGKAWMSRWLWLIGIILVIVIAGAIGLGWWASHKSNTSTEPTTLGGSSKEAAGPVVSKAIVAPSSSSDSVPHVGPTFTVARRGVIEARSTGLPGTHHDIESLSH